MPERDAILQVSAPATRSSLTADLRALGLAPGATLIVHSALSSLGWVCGGAVAVIEALIDAVGDKGTLVMPTHSAGLSDPATWRAPPVPEAWHDTIRATMPAFDPARTPTRGMGTIPELFRTWPGVRRSDHPSLSFAAIGPKADAIIAHHALADPFGPDSPLGALERLDAHVLLLGVDFGRCTALHLAEHRALPDRPRIQDGAPIVTGGTRRWVTYARPPINDTPFAAIGEAAIAAGLVATGPVAAARAHLAPIRPLLAFAETHLRG